MVTMQLTDRDIRPIVQLALAEDIGSGDASATLIPPERQAQAQVICNQAAIVCGRPWFDAVFQQLDPNVCIHWHIEEGDWVQPHTAVVSLNGPARALLSGERAALNFLQTLSATATLTHHYVTALGDSPTRLLDTRKTLPGLRLAQKYAVRCGGGHNHRLGLYDMIMLKENHIAAAGGIGPAVARARALYPELKVEVETENLEEVRQALAAGADIIMLDDFPLTEAKEAITLIKGKAQVEISGNITIDSLPVWAQLGADFISTGAITKHIQAVDFSMRITHE